jgi:hypothetical protein
MTTQSEMQVWLLKNGVVPASDGYWYHYRQNVCPARSYQFTSGGLCVYDLNSQGEKWSRVYRFRYRNFTIKTTASMDISQVQYYICQTDHCQDNIVRHNYL